MTVHNPRSVQKMGKETGPKALTLTVEYEVEVRDKNGKLLSKVKGESHTWVRNWIRAFQNFYNQAAGGVGTVSLIDMSDVSRSFMGGATATAFTPLGVNCGANIDAYGILVGSSNGAFDRTQTKLQTKIVHGSGAGQLLYGTSTVEAYAEEDTVARFRILRPFTNGSGAVVTVREIGIGVVNGYAGAYYYFLMARDVLPSPQSVPDAGTLTVRYRVYIAYA